MVLFDPRPTGAMLAVLAALGPLTVLAADHPAIERCREARNAAAQIACLEAALAAQSSNRTEPALEPEPPTAEPAMDAEPEAADVHQAQDPARFPPSAPDVAPAVAAPPGPETSQMPPPPQPVREQAAAPEPPPPVAQPSPPPAPAASVNGLGAEQVEARSRQPGTKETRPAATGLRVAGYSIVPYRRLQITLENGQVWRQIIGDTQRFRIDLDRNQTVDILAAPITGYRMRFNEMRRTIRVERVR